jgi:hypothetical protein
MLICLLRGGAWPSQRSVAVSKGNGPNKAPARSSRERFKGQPTLFRSDNCVADKCGTFWPALHRPFMSSSVSPFIITTCNVAPPSQPRPSTSDTIGTVRHYRFRRIAQTLGIKTLYCVLYTSTMASRTGAYCLIPKLIHPFQNSNRKTDNNAQLLNTLLICQTIQ